MKIKLGQSDGKNAYLDIERLLSTRLLIQANSGKGKSWLLRRLAEQMFGKVPVIIIDPEGEFATLREKFGYVLVGKGGETPADPRSAALVAQKLLELKASAVCDIYELKPSQRHEFVKNFIDGMIDAPKNLWHSCVVIVDEAHVYCPEKGAGESEASEAMISLATRGRKRGFCAVFATQRLGKLRKDAAAELVNVLVGGTFIDVDRKRAADTLGVYGKDLHAFFDQIKLLKRGSFFAFGPAISDERILLEVGNVETTHPEAGSAKHAAGPPPAPEEIANLLPKLSDLPKQAEEKAKTEAELRGEIRSLKAKLRAQPEGKPVEIKVADPKAIEKVVRPLRTALEEAMRVIVKINAIGFDEATVKPEEITKALEATAKEISRLAQAGLERRANEFEKLKREANSLLNKVNKLLAQESLVVNLKVTHNEPFSVAPAPPRPTRIPSDQASGDISRPQMAILRALAEFDAIGRASVPKTWVAALAGASHKSSAYSNNLGFLRSAGLIQYNGSGVELTAEGREKAPQVEPPSSSDEMLDRCLRIVSRPQGEILKAVHRTYPQQISKEELAQQAGASPTSSAYSNNLGSLRSAGMIEYSGGGVKASDWLFLE